MEYNTVSFPGLGIGEFTINPTAFKITDNITIEWYAILICAAIFVAYFVCDRLAKRFSIQSGLDAWLRAVSRVIRPAFSRARMLWSMVTMPRAAEVEMTLSSWKALDSRIMLRTAGVTVITSKAGMREPSRAGTSCWDTTPSMTRASWVRICCCWGFCSSSSGRMTCRMSTGTRDTRLMSFSSPASAISTHGAIRRPG